MARCELVAHEHPSPQAFTVPLYKQVPACCWYVAHACGCAFYIEKFGGFEKFSTPVSGPRRLNPLSVETTTHGK